MKTHKGSVLDIVFLVVMLTLVAMGILIVYHTTSAIKTALVDGGINSTESVQSFDSGLTAVADWNAIFAFVFIGVNLGTAVSAFMVRSHPIMFLVFFVIQVVAIFLSGQMITVWNALADDPTFATDVIVFSWVDVIFANYGVLTLIFSLLVALAMMAIPVG